ncbi:MULTISPECIES: adenylate/guanylate cyclase domain-containing protein [unclassified Acidovorax]|uniref:adenylate/guanylate cyclase domain-containing protein n=1 Tax=unclassified Acidovorax TaxID=2684926 RepID=UPI001C438564|nr:MULTISPECIES: adenylate/guanylate cyclase domain-containing protein [unclassified Acidovorax]MBV7461284.1 adenylate/guanylate cyclase domain-containing protein [Acidovorax sp. sif0632]MBV7466612.1 adenylate/guanylate cyclase domain-containing protein [Acidovorax sp. sif0613]
MFWTRATASDSASPAVRRQQQIYALAACALALLLVGAATFSRTWHALEFKTFDVLTAWTAPQRTALPVVILAIDEPTFQELQHTWPFPRSVHAALLQRLHDEGAAAVGLDIVFADPSTEAEDAALAQAIAETGPVVLAATREKIDSSNAALWLDVMPLQRFLDAGADAGDAGVEPDDDFVVRRVPVAREGFALRLAQRAAEARGKLPVLRHFDWIGYRGPRGTFDTRSYYQALEPGLLPAGFFKNKIVLVGRSARTATELSRSQADLFNSPFGTAGGERLFPGVELQATLVDNYLTGGGLRTVPEGWTLALVALLVPLLLWGNRRLHPAGAAALAAALVAAIAGASWWLFGRFQLWWPPLLPAAAAVAVYGAAALAGYAFVRRRARQTRAMFAQYVPPAVVSRLIAQPELMRLGGEAREVTLMFTDLANFTTLSEQLSAEQTVEVLTAYFNAMTPIVHATGGTVDKFIGDAVMAFWGAPLDDPQHAEHAVTAAISMQQAMQVLVAALRARGLPPIHMRIGLHTGRVVVGNVGSEQRFSYTAIGDAVNLAARLEGANKAFGTGILLSAATAAQLPSSVALRALDDVVVKGKTEPVRVFTPCDDVAVRDASLAALNAFHARDWDGASGYLAQVLARVPGDTAALRLQQRVAEARALPVGSDWSPAVALDKL